MTTRQPVMNSGFGPLVELPVSEPGPVNTLE